MVGPSLSGSGTLNPYLLEDKLKLAHKLAEALFFLHAAGFVHKNVTASSIAILPPLTSAEPPLHESAFLTGYDLIPSTYGFSEESPSSYEMSVADEGCRGGSIWDYDIYQHPDRLRAGPGRISRYVATYDMYSLGVVLLQIGLWTRIQTVMKFADVTNKNTESWIGNLLAAIPRLVREVGEEYARVVEWCLKLEGNEVVREAKFVKMVLDPLENLANAAESDQRS